MQIIMMIPTENRKKRNFVEHAAYLVGNPVSYLTQGALPDPFLSRALCICGWQNIGGGLSNLCLFLRPIQFVYENYSDS